jgi:hypothetical protein
MVLKFSKNTEHSSALCHRYLDFRTLYLGALNRMESGMGRMGYSQATLIVAQVPKTPQLADINFFGEPQLI